VLKSLGVATGDRVGIYLPMIPEAADRDARMRAHRRHPQRGLRRLLAEALRDRMNDAGAKVVVTADGGWRRGRSCR
jgi:acetyl-CoA synthetase